MKIIGLVLIFSVIAIFGFIKGYGFIIKLEEIENCKKFLYSVLINLESERLSVTEILNNIEIDCNDKTGALIKLIKERLYSGKSLLPEDIEKSGFCTDGVTNGIFTETLSFFGKYPAQEQMKEFEKGIKSIIKRYDEVSINFRQKAKLSFSLGIIAGIFSVIILI